MSDSAAEGWTPGTLYSHFTQRHADQERALGTAKAELELRLAGMNEFRASLEDQGAKFMAREEAAVRFAALEKELAAHTSRLDLSQGRGAGLNAGWQILMGVGAMVGMVVGWVLKGGVG